MISSTFRVKNKERFATVIKKKKFITCPQFTLHYALNDLEYSRVGITVSKKLGKAHQRNKIKRQIRHMVSECFDYEKYGVDFIIIARQGYLEKDFKYNLSQMKRLYKEFEKKIGGTL